jgi:hypothetical protein
MNAHSKSEFSIQTYLQFVEGSARKSGLKRGLEVLKRYLAKEWGPRKIAAMRLLLVRSRQISASGSLPIPGFSGRFCSGCRDISGYRCARVHFLTVAVFFTRIDVQSERCYKSAVRMSGLPRTAAFTDSTDFFPSRI